MPNPTRAAVETREDLFRRSSLPLTQKHQWTRQNAAALKQIGECALTLLGYVQKRGNNSIKDARLSSRFSLLVDRDSPLRPFISTIPTLCAALEAAAKDDNRFVNTMKYLAPLAEIDL